MAEALAHFPLVNLLMIQNLGDWLRNSLTPRPIARSRLTCSSVVAYPVPQIPDFLFLN